MVVSDELCGVEELLAGAGGVLDGLRHEAKRLEESLSLVCERIAAGEAVLSAVAAWRSIAQEAMVSSSSSSSSSSPSVVGPVGVSRGDQVVGLLAQDPSRVWRAEDVAAVLGAVGPESLRNTLCRLVNSGRLVRAGSGLYRVAA